MPFKKATRLNLTGIAQSEPKMDYRLRPRMFRADSGRPLCNLHDPLLRFLCADDIETDCSRCQRCRRSSFAALTVAQGRTTAPHNSVAARGHHPAPSGYVAPDSA